MFAHIYTNEKDRKVPGETLIILFIYYLIVQYYKIIITTNNYLNN